MLQQSFNRSTLSVAALLERIPQIKFFVCVIYFLSMLIPAEMFFEIAGVRFEVYRFVLMFCFFIYAQEMLILLRSDSAVRAIFIYVAMCSLALFYNHGLSSLESILINFLEVYVGFAIGLSVAGCPRRFTSFVKVVCVSYILLAPFAILESQDGYRLLHVWAANISGAEFGGLKGSIEYLGDSYYRYGLHRAGTVFSHPILYSIVAAITLPMVYLCFQRTWLLWASGLIVALVTSVTSSGIVMVILFLFMLLLRWLSKYYPAVYKHLIILGALWFVVVLIFSNRGPIPVLIDTIALNPATGYARYLQWEYVADDITANSIFGVGFGEWSRPWWMSASVDNYWLMVSLRFGCVALGLMALFYALSMKRIWFMYRKTGMLSYYIFYAIFLQLIFAGMTVHFFDRAALYIFLVLGMIFSFVSVGERDLLLNYRKIINEGRRGECGALS